MKEINEMVGETIHNKYTTDMIAMYLSKKGKLMLLLLDKTPILKSSAPCGIPITSIPLKMVPYIIVFA